MAADIFWLSAFIDLNPDEYDAAREFWRHATGYDVSTPRGEHGEFASLLPPDGDDHLRVQRLDDGPSRMHLDVHVRDIASAVVAAEALGADLIAHTDYAVMRTPGGLPFCFVGHDATTASSPTTWPGGHRSRVDQLCLDIPSSIYDRECAFWSDLTGWPIRAGALNEYARLAVPARLPLRLLLQRLGETSGHARAHLDISSSDRPSEVARLTELGAAQVSEGRFWTVLEPPAGPVLCVTDRDPDTGLLERKAS